MSLKHKLKLLLTKHPYDGHDAGYQVVARGLRDGGVEVVLGGPQLASEIVETAIQEDVDVIGYRIMSGESMMLISLLFNKMKERGVNIPVIVGGIVPQKQISELKKLGVLEVFTPGSSLDSIQNYMASISHKL